MPSQTLANRVAILEHKMQSLEGLPDRVASLELQIVQFRAEVRAEFSALRADMSGLGESLGGESKSLAETLRAEIRAGDEETRRQMRVLHEEVIARFALLDEHRNGRKRSPESGGRTSSSRRSPKR